MKNWTGKDGILEGLKMNDNDFENLKHFCTFCSFRLVRQVRKDVKIYSENTGTLVS